jgi:hypothetical protein
MRNYTKNEGVSNTGKNYSVYTYTATDGSETFSKESTGRGAPQLRITHDNGSGLKIFDLTDLTRFLVPTAGPKRPRKSAEEKAQAKAEKVSKDSILRETVEGTEKKTVLHYEDGTTITASGGRPKYHNEEGSKLVKIVSYVIGKGQPKKKGRSKIETEVIEVTENPRIEYLYGDKVEVKPEGKRGAPPAIKDGIPLTKIIKYVLAKRTKPEPTEDGVEPPKPTMAELGWEVGQKVTLKGSDKVAEVVVVRDYHVGVQFPGDKFVDTFPISRLVKVG